MNEKPRLNASDPVSNLGRRRFLWGSIAGAAGTAIAVVGGKLAAESRGDSPRDAEGVAHVPAHGRYQAGIDRPETPQSHTLFTVIDIGGITVAAEVESVIGALGRAIAALADPSRTPNSNMPEGPRDITATVGIGPRLVSLLNPSLPGATPLPDFVGDEGMVPLSNGGDLVLQLCASDGGALDSAQRELMRVVGGTLRWQQRGFRGAGTGSIVRNPLGFHDGIIVPTGEAELFENVWIRDGPAAHGTIMVVRRIQLDVDAFESLSILEQEQVIGREKLSGAPLSGGVREDEADLLAKTPDGEYLIPARSHVRAAHPSFTGSGLMLRRGYAYSNSDASGVSQGLLFICYQNDPSVFIRTQQRLDETDALAAFSQVTASGMFLVLPGASTGSALGEGLRATG
ncbi:MAG: Dyp-type peroxidase [Microbacterium sp.]|uniref:Dyp-type peroxidase n=1 Tax=Microbacterium sp. TaxID=51671 RepID=UPI003A8865B2